MKPLIAQLPDIVDVVAEWFNSDNTFKHVLHKGSSLKIKFILNIKELHVDINGISRIFQYVPDAEMYHWYEYLQETGKLNAITNYDLQIALLNKIKEMENANN